MLDIDKDPDFYTEEGIHRRFEEDELTDSEEGFMIGYLAA